MRYEVTIKRIDGRVEFCDITVEETDVGVDIRLKDENIVLNNGDEMIIAWRKV